MILLIDPAREPATVALVEDGAVIIERTIAEKRELSQRLLATIDEVLQERQLAVSDLAAIAVMRGPGPFTSLRIALAVANALARSAATPIVGLTDLAAAPLSELAQAATAKLAAGDTESQLLPFYDRPPTITPPRAAPSGSFADRPDKS